MNKTTQYTIKQTIKQMTAPYKLLIQKDILIRQEIMI